MNARIGAEERCMARAVDACCSCGIVSGKIVGGGEAGLPDCSECDAASKLAARGTADDDEGYEKLRGGGWNGGGGTVEGDWYMLELGAVGSLG